MLRPSAPTARTRRIAFLATCLPLLAVLAAVVGATIQSGADRGHAFDRATRAGPIAGTVVDERLQRLTKRPDYEFLVEFEDGSGDSRREWLGDVDQLELVPERGSEVEVLADPRSSRVFLPGDSPREGPIEWYLGALVAIAAAIGVVVVSALFARRVSGDLFPQPLSGEAPSIRPTRPPTRVPATWMVLAAVLAVFIPPVFLGLVVALPVLAAVGIRVRHHPPEAVDLFTIGIASTTVFANVIVGTLMAIGWTPS